MMGLFWSVLGVGRIIAVRRRSSRLARDLRLPSRPPPSFLSGAIVLGLATMLVTRGQGISLDWGAGHGSSLPAASSAAYGTISTILIPRIGAAALMAFLVAGQLVAGMLLDRIGFLGMAVREISLGRLVGAVLLMTGAVLVRLT